MLTLNLRADNGESTTKFSDVPEWYEFHGDRISTRDALSAMKGRRVCLLIHGYNVEEADGAYAEIAVEIMRWYDMVIAVRWPGSLGWWWARRRARMAGRKLADALFFADSQIDIEAHSLGCMVAMAALSEGLSCRNVILTAAAIDHDTLQTDGEYASAVPLAKKILVAYSANDKVLSEWYRRSEWIDSIFGPDPRQALGLVGPIEKLCNPNVTGLDLSKYIHRHGGYRSCKPFYAQWGALVS